MIALGFAALAVAGLAALVAGFAQALRDDAVREAELDEVEL